MRSDVTFRSGDDECAAWLYRPDGPEPAPLVVMAHGFSATRELRLDAYAERFSAAGIGALVFDYRHFGASGGEPRQLLDISRQHADYRAAIAHARALDWVDPERVGLFGSSFSGGHVLAVAARDPRIAAVVSQAPFTDGIATMRQLEPVKAARATVTALRDAVGALTGADPVYVPAVSPPGGAGVMNSPDAEPGFLSILPPDGHHTWENRVAARIMLRVGTYRPGRAASRIAAPVLFCLCDRDVITPPDTAARYAARAARSEVKRYPLGHFDIYTGEAFERAVADQTDFLVRHLRPSVDGRIEPALPAPAATG